jgi:hypothetical protein
MVTDIDLRRQRIDAQVAYEEATERLAGLIGKLKTIGQRSAHVASIIGAIELCPAEPLQSESNLLMLAPCDFEDLQFGSIRELGNAIVDARRKVAEAKSLAVALGYRAA